MSLNTRACSLTEKRHGVTHLIEQGCLYSLRMGLPGILRAHGLGWAEGGGGILEVIQVCRTPFAGQLLIGCPEAIHAVHPQRGPVQAGMHQLAIAAGSIASDLLTIHCCSKAMRNAAAQKLQELGPRPNSWDSDNKILHEG